MSAERAKRISREGGMSKDMLISIGAGLTSALLSLSVTAGPGFALVLVYLAPLPLYLVGLGVGQRATLIAGLTGTVACALFAGPLPSGLYAILNALPAWLVVRQALLSQPVTETPDMNGGAVAWYPVGSIIAILTGLGAGLLIVAALILTGGESGGLEGFMRERLNLAFSQMVPMASEPERAELVGMIAPMFPAAVVTSWLVMAAVNAALAQWALVRSGRNIRPTPGIAGLELPGWCSWAFVGSAALALAGTGEMEHLGRNLALVLAVPFFFLGLAVVHVLVRKTPYPGASLGVFYVILLLLSGWLAVLVTGLGFVEQWVNIRQRVGQAENDREDE
ncbi:MAG: YybS family protein, partial [Rhodospirillales bacterium]|nr:YybS family protein [Rhodospirillales bacterium]